MTSPDLFVITEFYCRYDTFIFCRFSVATVDSNGDDLALVRLPSLAVTINEDPDENVLPICVPWTGNELVIG
jgi:hypothetical protein